MPNKPIPQVFKRGARLVLMGAVLVAGACAEDPGGPSGVNPGEPSAAIEVKPIPKPVMSSLISSPPATAPCGAMSTYAMWTNPYVPGGSITVSNDAQNVYVTYTITHADWYLTDTNLAVEKNQSAIPMENSTTPAPWSFKMNGSHDPAVKTFTYTVSLSSIGAVAGQTIYVSAMAGVVYPVTGNYEGNWEWRTAWGVPQGKTSPLIQAYVVQGCGGTTPPPPPPPPPPSGGVITITFDDGWSETYSMIFPIMQKVGLTANAAVNKQPIVEQWSAYMNLTQVKALKAAGWSIQSHSVSHPDLVKLTAAAMEKEIADNKTWLTANALGNSPVFIVPFHSWGTRERAVIQKYHKGARGYTVTQFYPEKMVTTATPYDLTAIEPEYMPFTTPEGRAKTIAYIQRAVDEGKFLDVFFHHVTPAQKPAFETLMTEISAKFKSKIKTYDQIFPN